MDYSSVKNILIRTPDLVIQRGIGSILRKAASYFEHSVRLCRAAKLLVEELIEGELKQEQLSSAMRESEAGNRNLDWSILDGLTYRKIKLFPDLNSLQYAVDEIRRAKELTT